jgi:hypothetical protein
MTIAATTVSALRAGKSLKEVVEANPKVKGKK